MPKNAKKPQQVRAFRKAARELGADEEEAKFNAALRKIAKHNPDPKDIEQLADMIGQTDPNKDFAKKTK
jgi:hypothetical protein